MIDPRPISSFTFTPSEYLKYQNGEEVWKDINGWIGYEISTNGNIRSNSRINIHPCRGMRVLKTRILRGSINSRGYLLIRTCANGVGKRWMVHQLMCIIFMGHSICGYKLVVNHINFIRSDNRLQNLEITTQRINSNLKHIKHSSIYTGVNWVKRDLRWKAEIRIKGKKKHLGYFINEYDAHIAYESELKIVLANEL